MTDREYRFFRGKGLGGSSGINFLCYNKPYAGDIDGEQHRCVETCRGSSYTSDFERLGNPGWNWNDMAKYFKRVEGYVFSATIGQTALNIWNAIGSLNRVSSTSGLPASSLRHGTLGDKARLRPKHPNNVSKTDTAPRSFSAGMCRSAQDLISTHHRRSRDQDPTGQSFF